MVKNVERIYAQDEINIVNCYKLREILKEYNIKTEPYFFDYIDLDDNVNEFIETFKNLNFEVILVGI